MIISQDVFNKKAMTQEAVFKSEVLGGDVRVRLLSITEQKEFARLFQGEDKDYAIFYAASKMSVEPKFPSYEEFQERGTSILVEYATELLNNAQFFGMSESEKKEAIKRIEESKKEEMTEEDKEKKKKRKDSSS